LTCWSRPAGTPARLGRFFRRRAPNVEGNSQRGGHRRRRGLPAVLDELIPSAWHHVEQHANNPTEADHSRLEHRRRPMRGLQTDRTAQVIIAGHAFMQNLPQWTLRTRRRCPTCHAGGRGVQRTRSGDLTSSQTGVQRVRRSDNATAPPGLLITQRARPELHIRPWSGRRGRWGGLAAGYQDLV
jgi:hypothetical protein